MGEIRFVGSGETRGYPYPVCKKIGSTYILFVETRAGGFTNQLRNEILNKFSATNRPRGHFFSCSTQLSMKFHLLINSFLAHRIRISTCFT